MGCRTAPGATANTLVDWPPMAGRVPARVGSRHNSNGLPYSIVAGREVRMSVKTGIGHGDQHVVATMTLPVGLRRPAACSPRQARSDETLQSSVGLAMGTPPSRPAAASRRQSILSTSDLAWATPTVSR